MFSGDFMNTQIFNAEIYIRRRTKTLVPLGAGESSPELLAALMKNIEGLGWTLSPSLIEKLQLLSLEQLTIWYAELVAALRQLIGAHVVWKPMYPNFPQQVLDMAPSQLYVNAIVHYMTNRLPQYAKLERLPLFEKNKLGVLDVGSQDDFESIFTSLVAAKGSLSAVDKSDVAWFVKSFGDDIFRFMPPEVASRETIALVGALLLQHTTRGEKWVEENLKTATDVLRLACALCNGDITLATPTKFVNLSRPRRRLLLRVLDVCPNIVEDQLRWKSRWIRLGERLHPGKFATQFPNAFAAFRVVRGDAKSETFGAKIEHSLRKRDTQSALQLLKTRPGEMARRLDHVLRLGADATDVLRVFTEVAPRVSTPVLLQLLAHFKHRNQPQELRTFFPKGNVAKAQGIVYNLSPMNETTRAALVRQTEYSLRARFAGLEPLGACFLDENLRDFPVPFANRSASKALRTIPRGSRLSLPDSNVLRFFIWWKNGIERTDIDLSAAIFKDDFSYLDVVSYYNLKNFGGHHSGDIVDAPNGAAEFIDINIERTLLMGGRYVIMSLNSYTEQPYCDLPECFAGWMARTHANSGEIFEPKTVQNRFDLSADTRIALPLIFDLQERRAIWIDLALRSYPNWNNVENNLSGMTIMLRAMTSLKKLSLHELFDLHIAARGTRVESGDDAAQIFALEALRDGDITPFDGERIAANWM